MTQRTEAASSCRFTIPTGFSVLTPTSPWARSVYMPGCSILDEGFLDELAQSGSSNFAGVPYSYDLLEMAGFRERDFPALRFMTVAGGRLAPELVRRYMSISPRATRAFS